MIWITLSIFTLLNIMAGVKCFAGSIFGENRELNGVLNA